MKKALLEKREKEKKEAYKRNLLRKIKDFYTSFLKS